MLRTVEGDFITSTQPFTPKCCLYIKQGCWSQYAVQIMFTQCKILWRIQWVGNPYLCDKFLSKSRDWSTCRTIAWLV